MSITTRSRGLALVAAVALVIGGSTTPASARGSVNATGYALQGSAKPADVTRDGRYLRTIAISGVALDGPAGITTVSRDVERLRRAAHRHGRKAVLLLTNFNDDLGDFDERLAHRMLTSPPARAAVIRALTRAARGFDGVQIDLESLRARDVDGLVAFTQELRAALPGKSLSMAFMASTNERGYRARGYDLAALAPSLDRMILMAYDQHGPDWSGPGPIGSLTWLKRELRYFAKVLPNRKIDLGVGTYGYQWGRKAGTLTVTQARQRAGGKARWSARHGEWTAKLSGGRRIWWSDRRSLAAREKIARSYRLHGVSIWQIGSSGRLR
ncbi:glycosyl hydrolase family 18 protein [Aeromicrobium wangtongii]|uniref:Glycosyl hydrolase family 18 protein n=1 Tax=Aeromicrobium wangtongii TaxID=2969247 RepID=A0ABY5M2M5_9ACTN|nr:glycosyl hydrolase family 18 protein [Aeromicrobium wangtongii]MCD9198421.1 glycosyl hydrolase family 18 protein [Aeromicrobium wangtongii]UUP12450.1 glycosyl hydrolase family 18 protein [Aeromicrobium wangtongii]